MYAVEMLPAEHGDCLWIEWGPSAAPYRMLLDGGPPRTGTLLRERLAALPRGQRRFELLVVSHIDADHIGGILVLLRDDSLGVTFGDVWFNGAREVAAAEGTKSVMQGEAFTALLRARGAPVNRAFGGGPVMVGDDGSLPCVTLPGAMVLTLLGPDRECLGRLKSTWDRDPRSGGLVGAAGARHPPAAGRWVGGRDEGLASHLARRTTSSTVRS